MSMSVSNVNFKGEAPCVSQNKSNSYTQTAKLESASDVVDLSTKNTGESKKTSWGGAVASFFLSGLGQLCQGRTKDGLIDLGTDIGLGALAGAAALVTPKSPKLGIALACASSVGFIANKIHTIVDAARNGEKTQKAE